MNMELSRNQSIAGALIRFTVPLILAGLFQQLFNWVDAFIVGNICGEIALGAVGATTSIYNFFVSLALGFTSGLLVLCAQYYGSGKTEPVSRLLTIFTVVFGIVFTAGSLLCAIFAHQVLDLMGTPADLFELSAAYLQPLMVGIPALAIYNVYSAAVRGIGDSKAPFLSILVCSVINVGLDLLFVAGLHQGVAGAAWATAISQIAMAIFLAVYTDRRHHEIRFAWQKNLFDRELIYEGARFGLPPMIQNMTMAFGNIVLQRFMNSFGQQTVAAITSAYRVDSVILLPIINSGSGVATLVGQSVGAGDRHRAMRVLKAGLILMIPVSLVLTAIVLLYGGSLIAMFGLTSESVAIGAAFFSAIALGYPLFGLASAFRGYLEGLGDMVYSGACGIGALLVRIGLSYLLLPVFGRMVIAYAEMISWGVLFVLYAVRSLIHIHQDRQSPKTVPDRMIKA